MFSSYTNAYRFVGSQSPKQCIDSIDLTYRGDMNPYPDYFSWLIRQRL